MKATYIDYRDTNSFSDTVLRYIEKDPKLKPFISHPPDIEGFAELLNNKKVLANRSVLVKVLKDQYSEISLNTAVLKNISSLVSDDTYTITTGHQLNIFTGPLYFILKIVTAINLAAELKKHFPDKHFVPVYWMATEDHDFAEINHTWVFGKKISWEAQAAGATGRLATETMAKALKDYSDILGISENACKLTGIVNKAYGESKSLAEATRALVNALFERFGLVIIDADDQRLKQQFAPFIARDIVEQNSFREIAKASKALNEAGFHTQVNAREINFFYLLDGLRERISFESGLYFVLNSDIKFTEEQLKQEIAEHPERFSPNVVLRPLYQEIILPNLAYIGGGAEVVYWLQLKKNFDFYGVDFPILILRNSAMLADETIGNKFLRLGLNIVDLFTEINELKKNWVFKNTKHNLKLTNEWEELNLVFDIIKSRTSQIDPTLSASTEAAKARLQRQVLELEKKMLRAEKRNHETALSQINSIKEKLFPGGGLQERTDNFAEFYLKYGDGFIPSLIENLRPLDFKFTILS